MEHFSLFSGSRTDLIMDAMDRFMIIIPRDPGELHEHIETWIDLSARVDKWRDYYNVTDVMMRDVDDPHEVPQHVSEALNKYVPTPTDEMDELVKSFKRLTLSEPKERHLNNMKSKQSNSCGVNSPADAKDSSSSDPALTLKETDNTDQGVLTEVPFYLLQPTLQRINMNLRKEEERKVASQKRH